MSIGNHFRKDVISMGQRDESKGERDVLNKLVGDILKFCTLCNSFQVDRHFWRYGDSDH